MKESLLKYYQNELNYLREEGAAFAKAYPKIGSRLRLGLGATEDPFVGRLIESFAFLTARVNHKIDMQMQTMSQSILNVLYPNFLPTIPSLSTIKITTHKDIDQQTVIPKNTVLTTKTIEDKTCTFRTCYPIELQKIAVANVDYSRYTNLESTSNNKKHSAMLSIKLSTMEGNKNVSDLSLKNLRFYINAPQNIAFLLQQQLWMHIKNIEIQSSCNNFSIAYPSDLVCPVGFDNEENLFPCESHTETSQNILIDFFLYPKKFLYVDFKNIEKYVTPNLGNEIIIKIYFDKFIPELDASISKESLQLGCSPIINLFEINSVPIALDQKQSDYHVVPDCDLGMSDVEVYQVCALEMASEGRHFNCRPFFGYKYSDSFESKYLHWYHYKKKCEEIGVFYVPGNESFINIGFNNIEIELDNKVSVIANLLCSNRDTATQLPFGGNNPKFVLEKKVANDALDVQCLSDVTTPVYRDINENINIELIALIASKQIILEDNEETKKYLQNILSLYYFDQEVDSDLINHGIVSVEINRKVRRHASDLKLGFCHGFLLTVTIDKNYFPENNEILFGRVLHKYLNETCEINAFVELTLKDKNNKEVCQWKTLESETSFL